MSTSPDIGAAKPEPIIGTRVPPIRSPRCLVARDASKRQGTMAAAELVRGDMQPGIGPSCRSRQAGVLSVVIRNAHNDLQTPAAQ